MKNLYKSSYRFMLVTLLISLTIYTNSCKTTAKEHIAKTWSVKDFQFEGEENFANSAQHQKIFKEFREKASLEFNRDGSYYFNLVTGTQKGKWVLENKTSLVTTSDDGIITKNKILQLSEDKMVIEQTSPEGTKTTMTLVPRE